MYKVAYNRRRNMGTIILKVSVREATFGSGDGRVNSEFGYNKLGLVVQVYRAASDRTVGPNKPKGEIKPHEVGKDPSCSSGSMEASERNKVLRWK